MAIWYILWPFGIFFTVLVFCAKKNLATLIRARKIVEQEPFQRPCIFEQLLKAYLYAVMWLFVANRK
jgi:hypothetical protein